MGGTGCRESSGPEPLADFPGVWTASLEPLRDDSPYLWLPDLGETLLAARVARQPFGPGGFSSFGPGTGSGDHLVATLSGTGMFVIDITRANMRLEGTFADGGTNPFAITLLPLPARMAGLEGLWVTRVVTGAPAGNRFLDSLTILTGGRFTIQTYWEGPFASCNVRGLHGVVARSGTLVRWRTFYDLSQACQLPLRDSFDLVGDPLVRTRRLGGGQPPLIEKLTR